MHFRLKTYIIKHVSRSVLTVTSGAKILRTTRNHILIYDSGCDSGCQNLYEVLFVEFR